MFFNNGMFYACFIDAFDNDDDNDGIPGQKLKTKKRVLS